MTLSVAAVVVNYNTCHALKNCLDSLTLCLENGELEQIIVVDCSSSDKSRAMARERFPDVELIVVSNKGFGFGANQGIERSFTRYLLVLNADTTVWIGAITALFQHMESDSTAAIAGPRLRFPDGSIQSSRRRFPKRLTPIFESTIVQEYFSSNSWTRNYYVDDLLEDRVQQVDWVTGAALFVRREAYDSVGGFNTNFRMFSEEVEWCYRLSRHGWKITYVPLAEIMHIQGASTEQDIPSRQLQFDYNRVELHNLIFGSFNAGFVLQIVRLNYALHLLRESLKWLIGHKRELRSERISFYRSALAVSFRPAKAPEH